MTDYLRALIENASTGELIVQFNVPADKPWWTVPMLEPGDYTVKVTTFVDERDSTDG